MGGTTLFGEDLGGQEKREKKTTGEGAPRVSRPNRRQSVLRPEIVDQLIPPDHRARAIVLAVEQLDLSAFYAEIKSRGADPGRPATDPAMLIALWLFATSEGVGSGRQLERLCERDDAYRWICGGVSVNYHTLTDFRVDHGAALDHLMSQVLGVLMHKGLLQIKRVAQDGMRVRAHAGAASFRRIGSLKRCLAEARAQVRSTKTMLDKEDPTRSDKSRAAAERATRERVERVQQAMEVLKEVQKREGAENARASTTDPEARIMRMGDGGYRPAFNLQLATDTESRVIVGVAVTNSGSDQGKLLPMIEDVERRTGKKPKEWLVDGGYTKLSDLQKAGEAGVKVFTPVAKPRVAGIDPHRPKPNDPEHVAAWRKRMATERAKTIYRERAATAERINADLRLHRGLTQLSVRGVHKALTIGLWMALTVNVLTWISALPVIG